MLPNVEGKGDQPESPAWPADQVERRTIESLIPYARNSRRHSELQVAQIAASIREWGWTTPVLIDENSSVIAGHGRIMAAHKLGIVDIPVMVARGWSDAQKRAYVIADNKLALNADWDHEALKVEIDGLTSSGFEMPLLGFSLDELALLGGEIRIHDLEAPAARIEPKPINLKFGQYEIPLTDREFGMLEAGLKGYVQENGASNGFVEYVLR